MLWFQVNSTSKDPREQSQTTKSIAATNKPNNVQEGILITKEQH